MHRGSKQSSRSNARLKIYADVQPFTAASLERTEPLNQYGDIERLSSPRAYVWHKQRNFHQHHPPLPPPPIDFSLRRLLSKSLIIRGEGFSVELLPVIVLVCAIFKGHKWARRCRCEMGRKREARGVKRENACLGWGAETPRWL